MEDTEDETAFFRRPMARALRDAGFTEIEVVPFDFLHPSIPGSLATFFETIGTVLEKIPILREIAGSLAIQARKPRTES